MNTFGNNSAERDAALTGLAIVGFIALVALGIALAVYSTRFVPRVVGRLGAAAVYLGSVFTPSHPSLSVVPTASSTMIYFGNATSTPVASTTVTLPKAPARPVVTTAGAQTTTSYPVTQSAMLSGLPDLVVKIHAVGYLATTSATSFVTSATVPAHSRPAVNFTIKNIGTNVSGTWRFTASIPTQSAYVYQSAYQQSLAPGDSIDYTLGFDQPLAGSGRTIVITANFDHAFFESTFNNNIASTSVTVLGS